MAGQNGILLIFGEVQSGMGHAGRMWAADSFDMAPDMPAVARSIASGLPRNTMARMRPRPAVTRWPAGNAARMGALMTDRRAAGPGGG
jgi:4-aminobutyrate aminotransferase